MSIQFVEEIPLNSVHPRNVRLYLRTHGWERANATQDGPDVWKLVSRDGVFEVIAPSSQGTRDFSHTIEELLRTVSIAEDRSPVQVVRDLSTLRFDIQYIHCDYDGPSGTAPLGDAADVYRAAYRMFAASSATLEDPRLVLPQRRPARTVALMRRVLAGPTASGSYVVSLWTPVPPRLTPEEDWTLFEVEDEPYERAATERLHQALGATNAAARQILTSDDGLDAFIGREQEGVSANLCEALVALSGENETPFDVRFSWALDRPVATRSQVVPFSGESLPVLREAARELRARMPEVDVRFRGN